MDEQMDDEHIDVIATLMKKAWKQKNPDYERWGTQEAEKKWKGFQQDFRKPVYRNLRTWFQSYSSAMNQVHPRDFTTQIAEDEAAYKMLYKMYVLQKRGLEKG